MTSKLLMRSIIIAVVFGTLVFITLGLLQPAQPSSALESHSINDKQAGVQVGLAKGNAAPNFTLTTTTGQKVSLSDYRGKPIMLNFWMINCEGCKYEMPEMQKIYDEQRAAHKDLVMLGIDPADSSTESKQFAQQHHFTYPMLVDIQSSVEQLYAVRGLPTSYFIDRKGIIYTSNEGAYAESALQQVIKQISGQ